MFQLVLRRLSVGLFGLLVVLHAQGALARSAGIASSEFTGRTPANCNACHSNHLTALAPVVMLTANDTTLNPSQQITLTFAVTRQTPAQTHAGFNLRASAAGTFVVGGVDSAMTRTEAAASEATHSAPKPVTGETATFTVLWTPAVATSGAVTFTAWGNSVNLSGNNTGDYAEGTTLGVTVAATCTPTNWYADADGDGYGNAAAITNSCNQPSGHVASNTDCNDTVAAINPGATETCNGIDDNCAGGIDNGLATATYYKDNDGDGHGAVASGVITFCSMPTGYVSGNQDCNDAVATINPGATETCNGVDDNCSGAADEGLATTTFYKDNDADTYGATTSGTKAACNLAQAGAGYVATSTDCNDADVAINPGAAEICGNAKDDNCNGTTDTDATTATTYYKDNDGDGHGAVASGTMTACSMPTGYVTGNQDCNDGNAAIKPGATEVCNGVDDNCSGAADEGIAPLTCGTGACVTMVAACAGGVTQTCTPQCPDAGVDAADAGSDAADAGTDVKTDTAVDTAKPDVVADMTAPVDTAKPDVAADVPKVDAVPDAVTPDAAPVDTRPADAPRDTATDRPTPAADDGCDCRMGGANRGNSLAAPLAGIALGLLTLLRRRRR